MASDANVGKIVFVIAVSVFLYYFFWVSILPFMLIDEGKKIKKNRKIEKQILHEIRIKTISRDVLFA